MDDKKLIARIHAQAALLTPEMLDFIEHGIPDEYERIVKLTHDLDELADLLDELKVRNAL